MKLVRHAHFVLIYCTLFPFAAHAGDPTKPVLDRAHSLFNSFEVMCNLSTPNFEHLSAQAAAMRMKVLEDVSETTQIGETVQRKGWVDTLTSGPFALRTEKMSGSKGIATSCSIEGPIPDIDEFRKVVIKKLHLNTAPESQVVEGGHTYYWDNYAGHGTTVMVRDMDRRTGHFVQVKLLNMVENNTR